MMKKLRIGLIKGIYKTEENYGVLHINNDW